MNFNDERFQALLDQINSGQTSPEQLAQMWGMPPSEGASLVADPAKQQGIASRIAALFAPQGQPQAQPQAPSSMPVNFYSMYANANKQGGGAQGGGDIMQVLRHIFASGGGGMPNA